MSSSFIMPVVIFQMTAFKVVRELLVDKQKLAVAQTQQNIPSLVILQSLRYMGKVVFTHAIDVCIFPILFSFIRAFLGL